MSKNNGKAVGKAKPSLNSTKGNLPAKHTKKAVQGRHADKADGCLDGFILIAGTGVLAVYGVAEWIL